MCFAFTFSLLDVINFVINHFRGQIVIENHDQIRLLLATSMIMGACFGFIFGMMDVEDQKGIDLRDTLIREEEYCIPIGVLLGGLAGYGIQALGKRSQYAGYNGLHQYHENDDI